LVHGQRREDEIRPDQVAEVDAKVTQSNQLLVTRIADLARGEYRRERNALIDLLDGGHEKA
jgi:hypothetical protein